VHWAAQQLFQVALETSLLEHAPLLHLDQYVEVAVRPRLATGNRPEHPHPARAVTRSQTLDLTAASTHLFKVRRRPGWARVWVRHAPMVDLLPKLAEPVQRRIPAVSSSAHMVKW